LSNQGRGLRVSAIIPVLNEAQTLPRTLASITIQDPAPVEVVVVDGGSTDGSDRIAGIAGASVLSARPGRGSQLQAGARAASGDVLLFLHADTRLPSGAVPAITDLLEEDAVVGGRFRLRFPHRRPLLRFIEFLSRFPWTWTSYGDSGFFVRRSVYEEIGGFEDLPVLEDVRFFRRLKKVGRVRVLPLAVTTSCRRFCYRGPWRQLIINIGLVVSYFSGTPPAALAARYTRNSAPRGAEDRPSPCVPERFGR
jgi:rSAM/selenodomain-associated transferase 2